MRILYLHQYFNTPSMHGSTRSYEFARRLVEAGHRVEVITSDRTPGPGATHWYETEVEGIRVHWLPVRYESRMKAPERIRAFLKYAAMAGARGISLGGDLVFATSTPLTIALPAVWTARRLGVPMVFEVRDLWPEVPIAMGAVPRGVPAYLARQLERFAYRNAAAIVTLSPDMKEGILRAGVAPDRVCVIPNASDLELFDAGPSAGSGFRARNPVLGARPFVLYAGAIGRVNGVEYLARVAAAVRTLDPELSFVVLGSGSESGRVREFARATGVLGQNFFMLEQIPKSEVPSAFAAAAMTISLVADIPALWANSANKAFDSFAAGRPLLINHEGWLAHLLRDTGAGIVLPAGDVEEAAKQVFRAMQDPEWLHEAGLRARELAVSRFNRDSLFAELNEVLETAGRGA